MMMSEQPVFGKKPAPIPAGADEAPLGPSLRQSFAEEYEGFADAEDMPPEMPAPVEGLWGEPVLMASEPPRTVIPDNPWQEPSIYQSYMPAEAAPVQPAPVQPAPLRTDHAPWEQDAEIEVGPVGPRLSLPEIEPVEKEPETELQQENDDPVPQAVAPAEESFEEPMGIQDEVRAMAAQHQLWLESGGKEGRRAAFRGDRFRRADFSGLFLPEASFRGADLRGVRFRAANLSRVDFAEADLTSVDFSQALLDGASFQRAQLSHANFSNIGGQEADFSQCEGVGTNFNAARLEWAVLREAQLSEADFRQANLTKANLRGASLFRAQCENANLTQADCRDVNFEHAKLNDALLLQTHLRMANLEGVNMQAADFSQALEVPAAAAAQSAQQEREWLLQESQRLEILKAELAARERQLENASASSEAIVPRGRILNGAADVAEFNDRLKAFSKSYTKMGATWLVLVLAVVTLIMNVMDSVEMIQLSFLEILILLAMLVTPLAVCLMGVVKSMNLSRYLTDFTRDHD